MANHNIAGAEQPWTQDEVRCVACGRGLLDIPRAARFCPDCGAILISVATANLGDQLAPAPVSIWRKVGSFFRILHQSNSALNVPDTRHTIFLVREGYASAMLQLGWRYETGRGAARNEQEASRCYFKSALLGNAAARERLAPHRDAPVESGPDDSAADGSNFLTG